MKCPEADRVLKSLVLTVFRINGALLENAGRRVKPFGLTSAQFQVMAALGAFNSPTTAPQIARFIGITRQGVQKQLNLLLEKGLIECSSNPCHERSPLYDLSQKGHELHKVISQLHKEERDDLAEEFTLDEANAALDTLNRFYKYLMSRGDAPHDEENCGHCMKYYS